MNNRDYIVNALRTESNDFSAINERFRNEKTIRGIHAALGLVTEAAEFADVFKKHLFYGKEIDWVNLSEEIGDLFWYIAVMVDVLGKENFDQILQTNIDKLAARYKNKAFSSEGAIIRDLDKERAILENA